MRPFHLRLRRAFTLVELLIVIGIITLLLSILLPALSRVRFQAQCTVCASNIRQFAQAAAHYASDNDGRLPGQPLGSAGNAWDVPIEFYKSMTGVYKLPPRSMYCPLLDPALADQMFSYTATHPTLARIGYFDWIPRLDGGSGLAPPPVPGTPPYTYPMPLDPTPFAGPQRMKDAVAATNPIFTDIVSFSVTPPSTATAADPGDPWRISDWSNHRWNGKLESTNAAFADGHVERVTADAVRPRYAGNAWSWR